MAIALSELGASENKIRDFFSRSDTAAARHKTVPEQMNGDFARFLSGNSHNLSLCTLLVDTVLAENRIAPHVIDHFRNEFFTSQRISIDVFIERWPEFASIAKITVATLLLLCENQNRLDGDWYQQLLEAMLRDEEAFLKCGLRVITFNYDRSFFRYFWRAIRSNLHYREVVASEFLKKIEILHVYGSLGPTIGGPQESFARYGEIEDLRIGAERFDLAGKERSQSMAAIKEIMRTSGPITLFGFGFWPENLEILDLPKNLGNGLKASTFGLPQSVRRELEARYKGIILGETKQNVFDFVQHHSVFRF